MDKHFITIVAIRENLDLKDSKLSEKVAVKMLLWVNVEEGEAVLMGSSAKKSSCWSRKSLPSHMLNDLFNFGILN